MHTNNQLGPLQLDSIKENELCVPSGHDVRELVRQAASWPPGEARFVASVADVARVELNAPGSEIAGALLPRRLGRRPQGSTRVMPGTRSASGARGDRTPR